MTYEVWNKAAKEKLDSLKIKFISSNGKDITEDESKLMLHLHGLENIDDLNRFGNNLQWLTRLIYEHDPIELAPSGIPLDEYDVEARMILRELSTKNNPTLKEIIEMIYLIFTMQFTEKCSGNIDNNCYSEIAKELIKKYPEIKDK